MKGQFISREELENVFDNKYFKLPKKFLYYIGLWPFQRKFERIFRQVVLYMSMLYFLYPLVKAVKISIQNKDLKRIAENLLEFIMCFGFCIKYFASAVATKNLKIVFLQFARNWLLIKDPGEYEILEKFAARGKKMGIFYLGYFICCFIGFSFTPIIPVLLDKTSALNQSRPKILILNAEYPVDPNENYLLIYLFLEIYVVMYFLIIVGIDTMFMAIIHHFLGIISIINFMDIIRETYYNAFIAYIGMTTLFISIAAVMLANQLKILTMFEIFKILSLTFGVIVHGLYLSWCGQQITDYSQNLLWEAYNNEWYNIPKRSKTLLYIMMLRCRRPCSISAGGLTEINLYNFGMILKNAVSYMTVIASFNLD